MLRTALLWVEHWISPSPLIVYCPPSLLNLLLKLQLTEVMPLPPAVFSDSLVLVGLGIETMKASCLKTRQQDNFITFLLNTLVMDLAPQVAKANRGGPGTIK